MLKPIESWAISRALYERPIAALIETLDVSEEVKQAVKMIPMVTPDNRIAYLESVFERDDVAQIRKHGLDDPRPQDGEIHSSRWKIVHVDYLKTIPKAEWLVEPFIIEGGLSVLYGASGTFKSFSALEWALKVSQTRPVIYVVYEGLLGYRQRVDAWNLHNKKQSKNLYMCIGSLAVMDTAEANSFINAVIPMKPALIVLDTVARAMTGSDENSSRDMGVFVDVCGDMAKQVGCSVLVVHHTSKAGVYERGSNALRGAADIMVSQRVEDDTIIQECSKSKDYEPFPTMYKRPMQVLVSIDGEVMSVPVLIDSDRIVDTGDTLTNHQTKVLEALSMEAFRLSGATAGELSEVVPEINRSSMMRVISRLLKSGYVYQSAKRQPYQITDSGMIKLGLNFASANDSVDSIDSVVAPVPGGNSSVRTLEQPQQPSQPQQRELIPSKTSNGNQYQFEDQGRKRK